jgi:hypothetical protein
MGLTEDEVARIADKLADELERRGLATEEGRDELVPIRKYAAEEGVDVSTVYRRMYRWGVPKRTERGYQKDDGDRSATYVSRSEMRLEEPLATQSVRRAAGLID